MSKLEVDKITPQSGTTLTIGDSGDTIVIDSTSVSGAKLAAPTLVGSASSAGSILFKEDTDNGTNAVTLIGPAATADVTLTLPAATDTVVGRQTTDTLTNKTINASQLVDASIATGKLADDAVTYAKMQDTSTANRVLGAASAGTISEVQIATDMIVDANVTTAKINDNAVTLAKMASGTDGNIISYDASGNPVAVATGNDGQVLTSAGAGAPPVFETPAVGGSLVHIATTTVSSDTGYVNFDNCFTTDYEVYRFHWSNFYNGSVDNQRLVSYFMDTNGNHLGGGQYETVLSYAYANSGANGVGSDRDWSANFVVHTHNNVSRGVASSGFIDISNPRDGSNRVTYNGQSFYHDGTYHKIQNYAGCLANNVEIYGMNFTVTGGSINADSTFSVYGYKKT